MFEIQRNMSSEDISSLDKINHYRMTEIIEDHVPLKMDGVSPNKTVSGTQSLPATRGVCNPQVEKVSKDLFNIITDMSPKSEGQGLPNWNLTMVTNEEIP